VTIIDTRNALRRAGVEEPGAIRLGAITAQPMVAAA